jgi:hypothetical protein
MSNRIRFETDDLNEQLMLEMIKYFKANERWEIGDADRPGVDARNALAMIRVIARKKRMEIQRLRVERKKRLREQRDSKKQMDVSRKRNRLSSG